MMGLQAQTATAPRHGQPIDQQATLRAAAKRYARAGKAVIPCLDKIPTTKGWQHTPVPTDREIDGWQNFNTIGIALGEPSGNLVAIDFDGWPGYEAFKQRFPQYADSFTVATGSGRGVHIYIEVDILPATTKAMKIAALDGANIELKSAGQQVIAPPSIHPDTGRPYTVHIDKPILRLSSVDDIVRWIQNLQPQPAPAIVNHKPVNKPLPGSRAERLERAYIETALSGELAAIRAAGSGERNHQTFKHTRRLLDLAAATGLITADEVAGLVLQAAPLAPDFRQKEVLTAIASARKEKYRRPVNLPDFHAATDEAKPAPEPPPAPAAASALWFDGTLPDSFVTALLRFCKPSVAPVFYLIHELVRQGEIDPRNFTNEDVTRQKAVVGIELPDKTIAGVIAAHESYFPKVCIDTSTTMSTFGKKGHRPVQHYCLAPLPDVINHLLQCAAPRLLEKHFPKADAAQLVVKFDAAMLEAVDCDIEDTTLLNSKTSNYRFDHEALYKQRMKRFRRDYARLRDSLSDLTSSKLPAAPVRSPKDFKALFLRGQVAAGQGQRSGRELAEALGIERQYVSQVLTHAGLANIKQYEDVVIDRRNVDRLDRIGYDVQGYPRHIAIEDKVIGYDPDSAPSIVAEAVAAGKAVTITYQIASKQIIARDEVLPEPPPADGQPAPEKPAKKKPASTDKPVERRHYGPTYDPAWVRHHLILALHIANIGYVVRGDRLIDTRTGEVLRDCVSAQDIITLLRGQTVEPEYATDGMQEIESDKEGLHHGTLS